MLEGKPDEGRSQADGDRRTPARRQPYSPESATSTHYFIQHARNFAPDDGAITQFMHEQLRRAFQEDIDGLEAIESLLGYYAERQPEFSFHADRASLVMRRYLKRQATAGTALSCAELHGLRCLSSICKSSSISVAKRTPR